MRKYWLHWLPLSRRRLVSAFLGTVFGGTLGVGPVQSFAAAPDNLGGVAPNYTELLDLSLQSGGLTFHSGYSTENALNTQLEFVPVGETVERWSQMITLITTKPGHRVPPDQWVAGTVAFFQKTCGKVSLSEKSTITQTDKLRQARGLPADYPTFSVLVVCENTSPVPVLGVTLRRVEVVWIKGIKGWLNDYMIQRAWHADAITPDSILASKGTQAEWRGWIDAVAITGRPDAAAPPVH